ncbi:hypothetical protein DRJ22_02490 [Candidatus Woesearchaeota archaeon]|nr:MAG: hypothetical protein DRJ22_02490 [Candidatus Woesearchaeota archaeon]
MTKSSVSDSDSNFDLDFSLVKSKGALSEEIKQRLSELEVSGFPIDVDKRDEIKKPGKLLKYFKKNNTSSAFIDHDGFLVVPDKDSLTGETEDFEYYPKIEWILASEDRKEYFNIHKKKSGETIIEEIFQRHDKAKKIASEIGIPFASFTEAKLELANKPVGESFSYVDEYLNIITLKKTDKDRIQTIQSFKLESSEDTYKNEEISELKIISHPVSANQSTGALEDSIKSFSADDLSLVDSLLSKQGFRLDWLEWRAGLKYVTYIPVAGRIFEKIFSAGNTVLPLKKLNSQDYSLKDIEALSKSLLESALFIYHHSRNNAFSSKPFNLIESFKLLRKRRAEGDDKKKVFLLLENALGKKNWRSTPLNDARFVKYVKNSFLSLRALKPAISMDNFVKLLADPRFSDDWQYDSSESKNLLGVGSGLLGRLVYVATPLTIAAAVPLAYYYFREDIVRLIDSLIPDIFKPKLPKIFNDPGRNIGETKENIESLETKLTVEKELGKVDPKLNVDQYIQETKQILKTIDEDYNSFEHTLNHAVAGFNDFVVKLSCKTYDSLTDFLHFVSPEVSKAFEGVTNWVAYGFLRPKLDKKTREKMDALREQGLSVEDALTKATNDSKENAKDEIVLSARDQLLKYFEGKAKTYDLQSAVAELTEGYGNVVEKALNDYIKNRDKGELEKALKNYLKNFSKNLKDYSKFKNYPKIKKALENLEDLTTFTGKYTEKLKKLKEIYEDLGVYRKELSDHKDLGSLAKHIKDVYTKISTTGTEIRKEAVIAKKDSFYRKANPRYETPAILKPHSISYAVGDFGAIGFSAVLLGIALVATVKRIFRLGKK